MSVNRCSIGNEPELCCVGDPWNHPRFDPQFHMEPLLPAVISAAKNHELDPHLVDWHLEAIHGWEPHDAKYDVEAEAAAECLCRGGCE